MPAVRLLFSVCCVLLAAGCSHYQLGTGGVPLAFRTLYIEPVRNTTMLPQAQALVGAQLREAFARDGRVALVNSPEAADASLSVVLHDYHRAVAAVREGDTGLARKFNLVLGAACTLRDNRAGKMLVENRPVTAVREAFTDSGQQQAEYQALPLLAESVAGKIVHATLDTW